MTAQAGCNGVWHGEWSSCDVVQCPILIGACCVGSTCSVRTAAQCAALGGSFSGTGTTCAPNPCTPVVCRADTNCDGVVSFADINPFVQALGNLSAWQAAYPNCPWQNCDVNGDGVVSFADINPFVARLATPGPCLSVCRGDTNCDALISFADINPFVQALGSLSAWQAAHPACPWQNCDVNADGVVSFADINPFVAKLGSPGPCP
jgi:hypothetical protein